MEVNVKNYQAIKEVNLKFEPGITAIVGNSNNGKSSIIRSIEAAINNKGGSGFINYDADQCEVTIKDNDQEITWIKSKKAGKSHYIINGTTLKKIGQKQIPRVAQLLNMGEVEINNERFRLNFWKQMEYPFLVGKTPYQLFDFISRSDEQDLVKRHQDDNEVELKSLNSDISAKNIEVDLMTKNNTEKSDEIEALKKYKSFDTEEAEKVIRDYNSLANAMETATSKKEQIVVENDNINKYSDKIEKLLGHTTFLEKAVVIHSVLEASIKTAEEATESIKESKRVIKNYSDSMLIREKAIGLLKKAFEEIDKLVDQIDFYKSDVAEVDFMDKRIKDDNDEIKKILDDMDLIEVELEKFKVCPFCGSVLEEPKEDHNE